MSNRTSWKPGDYYMTCDVTGQRMLRSEARRTWNGLWVHKDSWDPKHPDLMKRVLPADKVPTNVRSQDNPSDTGTPQPPFTGSFLK